MQVRVSKTIHHDTRGTFPACVFFMRVTAEQIAGRSQRKRKLSAAGDTRQQQGVGKLSAPDIVYELPFGTILSEYVSEEQHDKTVNKFPLLYRAHFPLHLPYRNVCWEHHAPSVRGTDRYTIPSPGYGLPDHSCI